MSACPTWCQKWDTNPRPHSCGTERKKCVLGRQDREGLLNRFVFPNNVKDKALHKSSLLHYHCDRGLAEQRKEGTDGVAG